MDRDECRERYCLIHLATYRFAILDLTGVDTVDTATAAHLIGLVSAAGPARRRGNHYRYPSDGGAYDRHAWTRPDAWGDAVKPSFGFVILHWSYEEGKSRTRIDVNRQHW